MSDVPYLLRRLVLTGFRAYLLTKEFNFVAKRCLAVFGPNGSGKSSIVDALEFVFSTDGTLERLGQRTINNQAGPVALAHNAAEAAGLKSSVTVAFAQGKAAGKEGTRQAVTSKRPIPAIAKSVRDCFVVDPIIRGYSLRAFVESRTAEQRYTDVATWLQLGPLVEVQKNLRAVRAAVKVASEDGSDLRQVDLQVARLTGQKVTSWDEAACVAHVNDTAIAPLDAALKLSSLNDNDTGYLELIQRAKDEEGKLGLDGLRLLRRAAAAIWGKTKDEAGEHITGALPTFEAAATALGVAVELEATERAKAKDAVFQKLWSTAAPLFQAGAEFPVVCPVCTTPLDKTAAGSAAEIDKHISQHLADLATYAAANKLQRDAGKSAADARRRLLTAVDSLQALLREDQAAFKAIVAAYRTAVDAWRNGAAPESTTATTGIAALIQDLDDKIDAIEKSQGEHTYVKAKTKTDELRKLKVEHATARRTLDELGKLSTGLAQQATVVSGAIRAKVQSLLDRLRQPTNEIYALIQGQAAAKVRLELPAEDDSNQQRLLLLVDFAANREGVQPSGYLSDSQIHSLALALRLAAILEFNKRAPLVVLDDIVTSYDADHRRTFAQMLAAKFSDCQTIIVTHDERLFLYLKDLLSPADWTFNRIIGLVPGFGPRLGNDMVSDEMIESRWSEGQSAANEMRQAEEEWLLARCREFGVDIRIRPLERAYSYERAELASALASFLGKAKLTPQPVAGIQNRFLDTLQKGEVENFGSHFQDAMYGAGSIGDEKARWEEFKAFRDQFKCTKCGRERFIRPVVLKRPVCAHDSCQAPFEFASSSGQK